MSEEDYTPSKLSKQSEAAYADMYGADYGGDDQNQPSFWDKEVSDKTCETIITGGIPLLGVGLSTFLLGPYPFPIIMTAGIGIIAGGVIGGSRRYQETTTNAQFFRDTAIGGMLGLALPAFSPMANDFIEKRDEAAFEVYQPKITEISGRKAIKNNCQGLGTDEERAISEAFNREQSEIFVIPRDDKAPDLYAVCPRGVE